MKSQKDTSFKFLVNTTSAKIYHGINFTVFCFLTIHGFIMDLQCTTWTIYRFTRLSQKMWQFDERVSQVIWQMQKET